MTFPQYKLSSSHVGESLSTDGLSLPLYVQPQYPGVSAILDPADGLFHLADGTTLNPVTVENYVKRLKFDVSVLVTFVPDYKTMAVVQLMEKLLASKKLVGRDGVTCYVRDVVTDQPMADRSKFVNAVPVSTYTSHIQTDHVVTQADHDRVVKTWVKTRSESLLYYPESHKYGDTVVVRRFFPNAA